ncbi:MAG TPA: hypothetical protein VK474_03850 [Chthoniobacterales bacterium]|nr:hypothetical protein [Chthoniobacterales bacterium]
MKLRLLCPLLFVAGSVCAQGPVVTVDEAARFLAGLPVEGALAPLMTTPGWQEQAREMDEAWTKKRAQQILPIRDWMWVNAEPSFRSTATMYYMFAGPDFLYANIFFPYASTYVLAGLEPVGQVPDLTRLSPEELAADLTALRGSMSTILRFQYFITKDMRAEFGQGRIVGTLPILYVFLARLGYRVLEVTPMTSPAEGVKITFQDPTRREVQTLFYFKTDLSGNRSTPFLKWCAARGPGVSLLKAASYLMHSDGFNGVRNFLLENSRVIVQDDSGIPLRGFPKGWSVQCFGRYVPHREMFAKYFQPDLAAVFTNNPPSELGFAFGYHWQKDRGLLMLARPERAIPPGLPPVMKALPPPPEEQPQKLRIRK